MWNLTTTASVANHLKYLCVVTEYRHLARRETFSKARSMGNNVNDIEMKVYVVVMGGTPLLPIFV